MYFESGIMIIMFLPNCGTLANIKSISNVMRRVALRNGKLEDIPTPLSIRGQLSRYPGNFFRARGDFPNNIPLKNMEYYLQLEREIGAREG